MAQAAVTPASAVSSTAKSSSAAAPASSARQKYDQERSKRIRSEGISQFVDLYQLEKLQRFKQDPWVDRKNAAHVNGTSPTEVDRSEILIIGAGYGGLLYAVRLLEAGFKLEDIHITDSASGFGGTWYWNRYPGLRCDIESYIYMPLLEETGYMPKEKYSTGQELREHAERIAKKYGLADRTLFQRTISKLEWDDQAEDWVIHYTLPGPNGTQSSTKTMRSRFVALTTGFTLIPHAPQIPGIETFQGELFHTARWDYGCTGGSATDPALTRLTDKSVGIIGTGATSVQVVPALAEWAKELYVFQRTPSAVDRRDNRKTEAEWWQREVQSKPGWQKARRANFNAFLTNISPKPATNLVGDGWTTMLSYSALVGNPDAAEALSRDQAGIEAYAATLHALDLPRQEQIRRRVEETVKDPATADKLKPWYPGWCKRPCFHDEYLETFNRPNVTLVDTDGRGVESITPNGVVINGKEYKIDVLILGTGYRSPFLRSPGGRVNIEVLGRDGISLDKKWMDQVSTLHGMMSNGFPNLFWPGLAQSGGTPNFSHCMDLAAQHVGGILSKARAKMQDRPRSPSEYQHNFVIEVTKEGENEWSEAIAAQVGVFAATAGCTPSYINAEGEFDRDTSPEVQKKRAKGALWGRGFADFASLIEEWRAKGDLTGLEVREAS